ncbi:MAG: hypothetical protein ABSC22_16870 [Roseiarcus sp.]|jgi:hypothetical protein
MGCDGISMISALRRETKRTASLVVVATLLGALAACSSMAQDAPAQDAAQPESPLRSLMKGAGLATDVDPPPDFVRESRPAQEPAPIPAFTTPAEPPGAVKTAKELEALDNDLEAVAKRHDALRAAFPPSAKAVAQAAAAKKAKSKAKPASSGPIPTF